MTRHRIVYEMIDSPGKIIRKRESLWPLDFDAWLPRASGKCTTLILEPRKTETEEYIVAEERLVRPQPIEVPTGTNFNETLKIN